MRGFDKLTHRSVPELVEGTSSQFTDFNQFALNKKTKKQKNKKTKKQLNSKTTKQLKNILCYAIEKSTGFFFIPKKLYLCKFLNIPPMICLIM